MGGGSFRAVGAVRLTSSGFAAQCEETTVICDDGYDIGHKIKVLELNLNEYLMETISCMTDQVTDCTSTQRNID